MGHHAETQRIHVQPCGCCHAGDTRQLCALPDDTGAPVPLYLCQQCGAITPGYTQAQHDDNTRRQTSYYENKWDADTNAVANQVAEDFRGVVQFYRDRHFLPPPQDNPVIIDIGAGRGALVEALRREGYQARGGEPAQGLVERAHQHYKLGPSVLQCLTADAFLAQIRQSGLTVDAAFLWHVIEHVEQPAALLRTIAGVLGDTGVIILQAPLPLPSSIFPEHLYLLTRKTVFSLARMSGLRVAFCDISHHEQFISFVLCKPDAHWATIPDDNNDVLDSWINDLQATIAALNQTCTWQREHIRTQTDTINAHQTHVRQLHEIHQKAVDSPKFLLKRLAYVLLKGKQHG